MARIAFDIDEKTKRKVKVRLAEEGKTLSEVMRALCLYYENFGLPTASSEHLHDQEGKRHFTPLPEWERHGESNENNDDISQDD